MLFSGKYWVTCNCDLWNVTCKKYLPISLIEISQVEKLSSPVNIPVGTNIIINGKLDNSYLSFVCAKFKFNLNLTSMTVELPVEHTCTWHSKRWFLCCCTYTCFHCSVYVVVWFFFFFGLIFFKPVLNFSNWFIFFKLGWIFQTSFFFVNYL